MNEKLVALGVYIFAGGFTVGVSRHFKVRAHLEDGMFGVATTKLNFPKLPVFPEIKSWPLKTLAAEKIDFIYSNPPCSPWSATGRSSRRGGDNWRTDLRVSCVINSFNVFKKVRPHVWVWESVPRAFTSGRDLVDDLTRQALRAGYSVTYFLTDASFHGLPQRRRRFHMVVHNVALSFPKPSMKIVTVGEALKGIESSWLPKVSNPDSLKLIKQVKQGESARHVFDRLNPKAKKSKKLNRIVGRPAWMNHRLDPDKPSGTLIGAGHCFHPTAHRIISPEEQAALCGYPKGYKWAGHPGSWYAQISRAVTPVIGDYLGGVARRGIEKGEVTRGKVVLIDYRNPDNYKHEVIKR